MGFKGNFVAAKDLEMLTHKNAEEIRKLDKELNQLFL